MDMAQLLSQYWSEIVSAVVGAIGGATLTFSIMSHRLAKGANLANQNRAQAGRDNIGRDKVTIRNQP